MSDLVEPQPLPVKGSAPATWDLVIADVEKYTFYFENVDRVVADMRARDDFGAKKYGVRHQHDDGRDHLVDAYQELLDAALYLRAAIEQKPDGLISALYQETLSLVFSLRDEFHRRKPKKVTP